MSGATHRSGLLAGGNFLIDHVKVIDSWPAQDALANVLSQNRGNGGGPYNVLKDLANMETDFPLAAAGLVGKDDNGAFIKADLDANGIDSSRIQSTDAASTSFTDVMTEQNTGRRTFFHSRGANALLDTGHFDFSASNHRLFYLGYLMLLDTLDALQSDGSNKFATVLKAAKESGHVTIADAVSTDGKDYAASIKACLPYLDYLLLNEWEARKATGKQLFCKDRPQWDQFRRAAQQLHDEGATRTIIIHFPSGAYALHRDGSEIIQGSVKLPPTQIVGAVGAGDAFCAGLLSGIHHRLPIQESLKRAACVAASSLQGSTSSNSIGSLESCLALGLEYGFQPLV
ncbi:MAG: carbohydrate kinase family protein [Verrucomicrobiota bacterium]